MVHRAAVWWLVAAVSVVAVGCGGEEGPTMRPGENCLRCHGSGEATFSAAGTVYHDDGSAASGLTVTLVDADATEVSATTNSVGNFYFEQPLVEPFQVTITDGTSTASMQDAQGACNACHQAGGAAQAHIVFP